MEGLDRKLQFQNTQLLPRRITFVAARSASSGFVPPNNKYTPINNINTTKESDTNTNNSENSIPRVPPLKVSNNWKEAGPVGPGLRNMGNTCFLNATLQCLSYTPPLINLLQAIRHTSKCRALGFCIFCFLEKHFESIKNLSNTKTRSLIPSNLVKNIRAVCPTFRPGRQEDAHEFMRFVVSGLQSKEVPKKPGAKEVKSSESDIFSVFGGYLRSEVHCFQCKQSSFTFDEFQDLSLEISHLNTLEKCLDHFTAPEILEKKNAYACQKCKTLTRASKRLTIHSPPAILVIHLKRFSMKATYSRISWDKNKYKLKYPSTLDLAPFLSNKQNTSSKSPHSNATINNCTYSLYGVLIHEGHTMNSGHYYSYAKASNNLWYQFNDEMVSQVNAQEVLRQEGYILFYKREGVEEPSDHPQPVHAKEPPTGNGTAPNGVHARGGVGMDEEPKVTIQSVEETELTGRSQINGKKRKLAPGEMESPAKRVRVAENGELNAKPKENAPQDTPLHPTNPEPSNGTAPVGSAVVTGKQVIKELESGSHKVEEFPTWEMEDNEDQKSITQLKTQQKEQIQQIEMNKEKLAERDEWDKALDKGRLKKVKQIKEQPNGANPFQLLSDGIMKPKKPGVRRNNFRKST
uniref:Ubiquitin carboxyl-terminal hydrolase n=1 Tax=Arcella intermedia TaxID=1963864 RepID=A0A6B2KZN0_9EUKA